MTDQKNSARNIAVNILEKVDDGSFSNIQLNQDIKNSNLIDVDKNLLTELVYGVLQHRLTLDYYLSDFVRKPELTPRWVINLLRTAIFQMEFLDRIPDFAIFNESIEIAKLRGNDGIRKMVTGVLRSYQRNGKPDFSRIQNPVERLSVQYSVALWIVDQLSYELGVEKCTSILESVNQPANLSVRVNRWNKSHADIIKDLEYDYQVTSSKIAQDGLKLSKGPSISESRSYIDGDITVQDESAMLVAETMQLEPDQVVLDACAAPGGKTTQIAEKIGQNGKVLAWDVYDSRVKLITQNAQRMHLTNIDAEVQDAEKARPDLNDHFDRILVDAPCSGLGLIRRKPEIRYLKSKKDSSDLHQVQLAILDNVSKMVKNGGILTYSTCTILRKENQDTINQFLASHPEFELQRTETAKKVKKDRNDLSLNIYPDDFGSDGFFIANLKKVK
ncbi:16S rRNA (cytosine(967)-C(5))-methyltransferase RsmB [Pediococcus stilesii]|uniref:16S rRNA (cytosine(967)-C(5))-methyltransferase n=1 Tax=Pediococcus stilesii TaxID=331679 RepID=A0A5R9BVN6_9LACO|nr:16S rRNA (cytosine(967)-C(5))-methyltransferase RsmB [Pediococcus stilesii]TLQ04625.1 16S rRNA (cytosine(967)-C(5))-methyltransferase RsmB [Pediococcus stilesii]